MVTNLTVVIISQYIRISNYHVVHLKLIQYYLYLNKAGKIILQSRCLFPPEAINPKTSLGIRFLSLHSRKSMIYMGNRQNGINTLQATAWSWALTEVSELDKGFIVLLPVLSVELCAQ